ncbi:MAG: LPXTG cell wall anchor domain-containing protein, partial [Thermoleophilia bacterium]
VCEGDDCEPVCEGDDCEPVCEGDDCNPALDEEQDPPVDNRVSEPLSSSTLPNTGADLSLLLALGLGLMLAGAMLPAARMARQKQR